MILNVTNFSCLFMSNMSPIALFPALDLSCISAKTLATNKDLSLECFFFAMGVHHIELMYVDNNIHSNVSPVL